ncbi:MAG: AMP-binding protein, partial [Actinomycetota bacterium]|nr:AMP-binding protein [Actinomycetota bacterium]
MKPLTLPDLLRQAAVTEPDRVALTVDGGASLTYHGWERRSDAAACGLVLRGVRPRDRVALLFDTVRWTEYAVTLLAVYKAGAVAVPLSTELSRFELDRILRDCRPSALVAPPGVAPPGAPVPAVETRELEEERLDPSVLPSVGRSALADLLYLSRPLSRPFPIPRSHGALLAGPSLDLGSDRGFPALIHAFPVGSGPGQDALCACLHPMPLGSVVLPTFDPERFCALLAKEPILACWLHPSHAQALVDSGLPGRHSLTRVTKVVLSSGHAPPELLLRLTTALPRATLHTVDVLDHPPGLRTVFRHDRSHPASIGRPCAGTVVRISDETGQPLGSGEVGQVRVGGVGLSAELEAATETAEGEVATGDLGYVDDRGFLYVVTGRSDVVRCHASTLVGTEVESVLREHASVDDAAVFSLGDARSRGALAAAVVLASPASGPELQALVRERLGEDKTPATRFFLEELPRNRQGMLLRSKLRRRLGLDQQEVERVAAPTAVEESIAAMWRRVLEHRDIGLHDDFFEIGGHWSAACALLALLQEDLEVRLPLTAFLDSPTVAGLASAVERLRPSDHDSPPAVAFSQEGMVWHERFAPGCQNLPGLARRYRGPLDVGALARALDEIVRRHGALRTNFEVRDGRLVQVVRAHRSRRLAVSDLSGLPPDEREEQVEWLVAEAGRRPFDLVTEALFEPTLVRLAEDDHVLIIRTHHSVFDDWSVGVFRRELAMLYSAYADGEASPLPELPLQ